MARFIVGRLIQTLATLFVVTIAVFILVRLTGDPVDMLLPIDATPELREELRTRLGVDQPQIVQYWRFIGDLASGDLGTSIRTRKSVTELIGERFPNTVQLVGLAMLIALAVAIPLGVMSAVHKGSWIDTVAHLFSLVGQSIPAFWAAVVLILIFGVYLGILPTGRQGGIDHIILPAVTTAFFGFMIPGVVRLLRSSMLEVLDSEYVKLARMKGLRERSVIWKHAFKNAVLPVVTFVGFYFGILLSGSVVVETVFAWPGIGRLAFEAVVWRDYPVIQGVVLLVSVIVLFSNLLVDILYAYLDPRIRYS
jgi:peptide/nickel transport system permease protein